MAKKAQGAGDGQYMFFSSVKAAGNVVEGTAGDDNLDSDSSNKHTVVRGNAGNDRIATHDWNVIAEGGTGNDEIVSGNAGDLIMGGEGNDTLVGQDFGTGQVDQLYGENGNDTLINDGGYVHMEGGAGKDQFIIKADAAGTTITDFKAAEGDVVRIEGIDTALAQQLASGAIKDALQEVTQRYNLRLEKVKPDEVQMQVVTGDNGKSTIQISGK